MPSGTTKENNAPMSHAYLSNLLAHFASLLNKINLTNFIAVNDKDV